MIPTLYKRARRGDDKPLALYDGTSVSSGSIYNNDGRPVYQIKFGPWHDNANQYEVRFEQPELEKLIISLAGDAGFYPHHNNRQHPAAHSFLEHLPLAAEWLRALADKADAMYKEKKAAFIG